MITKSQFCHGGSVSDVGDLVEVILASVIIYFFYFTVGSHFVAFYYVQVMFPTAGRGGGNILRKLNGGVHPAPHNPHPIYDTIFLNLFMTWPNMRYFIYDVNPIYGPKC